MFFNKKLKDRITQLGDTISQYEIAYKILQDNQNETINENKKLALELSYAKIEILRLKSPVSISSTAATETDRVLKIKANPKNMVQVKKTVKKFAGKKKK